MFPIRFREGDGWIRSDFGTGSRCGRSDAGAAPGGLGGAVGTAAGRGCACGDRARVDDERRCPHCASAGAVSRGKGAVCGATAARPAARHSAPSPAQRCPACTTRSAGCPSARPCRRGDDCRVCRALRDCAEYGVSLRHRFLKAPRQAPDRLRGIVEADETFVLESRKGSGSWTASRAGAAAKPANAASRASRCRSWSPPTAPARPSAAPCRSSTPRA